MVISPIVLEGISYIIEKGTMFEVHQAYVLDIKSTSRETILLIVINISMKINYKLTTIVLAAILIIVLVLSWGSIFPSHKKKMNTSNSMSGMHTMSDGSMVMNHDMGMGSKNMHQMPDGSMMMNHGADMMDMTMRDMMTMMEGKSGTALEKEFILGMIPHHQGAVDMANKLLADPSVSDTLKDFAKEIISAQEKEIKMMNEWLKNY